MDINLILSAQTLSLAPQVKRSELKDGIIVLKNIATRTYLRVTPEQWQILRKFEKPNMVPNMLGDAIRDRECLALGESYELILKALKANILLEPGVVPETIEAFDWQSKVRASVLERPLMILFTAGLVMALGFTPKLPSTVLDWTLGLVLLCASLSFGEFLAACMIREAGGEVYKPRWNWFTLPPHFTVDMHDAVMLKKKEQAMIALAVPAVLAASAGIAAWHEPGLAFFSLVGLVLSLRPIFGGRLASLIHVGSKRMPSDAEHDFLVPPNRHPKARVKLMIAAITNPTSWARIGYGVLWTLAILYWVGRLTVTPPWTLLFWKQNGLLIAIAIGGSLALLGLSYFLWEMYHWSREFARGRRNTMRLWKTRWFGAGSIPLDESSRVKMLTASPLFGTMPPPKRQELARTMAIRRYGPWTAITEASDEPTHVAIIVSGKISLRRKLPTGRTVQVQVLSEGDVIGLHDLADPKHPGYRLRSVTPVTLLTIERAAVQSIILNSVPQTTLVDAVLKRPFLRRISLCRNWHLQAVNRFARLSSIADYKQDDAILSEGQTVEDFFVIFEGDAKVSREGRGLATIYGGDFFGEIGLMQNSSPNASVTAHHRTRCLRIPRVELLRFVTHNYTVALEIERVSSERLGRPLFPLKVGDFRVQ
jgi:CRP-like cAMP-binding protein